MSAPRIAAFFQHMPPYSGAAGLRGASIMNALAGMTEFSGTPLRVYTTTPNPVQFDNVEVVTLPVRETENTLGLLRRVLGELRMGWLAGRALTAADERYDLVLISTPGYIAALIAAALARRRGIAYAIELRDVYPQVYAEAKLIRYDSFIYRTLWRWSRTMYEGARHVIAATRGLERAVRENAPRARVTCVYNGFPPDLLQRNATKHERFTVCFHGVLGFFQDVDTLIEVARRLGKHEIDVIAIGYGRKEATLQAARLPNLRFLGRRSFDDTMSEIERCHVGLCLRLADDISKDAFPVKVWEYLGLGLPSIVTPHCEAGEFLEQTGCGLQLDAGNVDAIVTQVVALASDRARLDQLANACRTTASRFGRDRTGREAAFIIRQALDAGPPPSP